MHQPQQLEPYVQCLQGGGVVAAATESFFGLLVDAANPLALDRLFAAKQRDQNKAVALMTPDVATWQTWVGPVSPQVTELVSEFWPGRLTIALPPMQQVDPRLLVDGTLGVRQPGSSPAADLVTAFGGLVTATSANLAGEPPLATAAAVSEAFAEQLGAHFKVLEGDAPGGEVSTIVVVKRGQLVVPREGAVSKEQVFEVWRQRAGNDVKSE